MDVEVVESRLAGMWIKRKSYILLSTIGVVASSLSARVYQFFSRQSLQSKTSYITKSIDQNITKVFTTSSSLLIYISEPSFPLQMPLIFPPGSRTGNRAMIWIGVALGATLLLSCTVSALWYWRENIRVSFSSSSYCSSLMTLSQNRRELDARVLRLRNIQLVGLGRPPISADEVGQWV